MSGKLVPLMALCVIGCTKAPEDSAARNNETPKAQVTKTANSVQAAPTKGVETLSESRVVAIGEQLYNAKGGNSCNDCHGVTGQNGRLKQAANLTKPSTWKGFAAVQGDLSKLEERTLFVIEHGAGQWNQAHPDASLDIQMLGIKQGAARSALRKVRKELSKVDGVSISKRDLPSFGAKAVYTYIMRKLATEDLAVPEQ